MLKIGSVLDGKYKILQEIGHGGMSVVYLALNERANKTWAVKEVRKDGGNDNEVVSQSLIAETEMLKKLNHPNLPSIIDVIDTKDSIIIVMDYIQGGSLQKKLSKEGAQNPEDVIMWSKQLCDVLGYLHGRKPPIIYRDMKPANVMLKPDGNVSLIDFGTAREYKAFKEGDTTWLGTRGYAAPEQFGGRGQTDARTDIYCLGATMYHLLTGKSPADTQFVIYPIGQKRPELAGTGLEKIVIKCCQPDPENRYQNCAELMYALEHVHDDDDAVRKERNRKWNTFLASAIVTILGIIGMITFTILKNGAIQTSYDTYISQAASMSSDLNAATSYYSQALELQPDKIDAYDGLLHLIADDNIILPEEKNAVEQCINSTRSSNTGTRSNLEILRQRNPEGYADFEYRLGTAYYTGFAGGKRDAYNTLSNVIENEYLPENKRNIAKTYYTLSQYYVQLGDGAATGGNEMSWATDSVQFSDLWNALYSVVADTSTVGEKAGGQNYAVALYREIANQISENISRFRNDGVSLDQMRNALDLAAQYVNAVTPDDKNRTLIEQTRQAIDSGNKAFASYSGTRAQN
ncbi:MAG: serine/threonine-protein kinase [Erysipelotrichaceae bacterium]|nr:serine/threonine-protein kinase [Erysipelotrichaceae bacterium]